MKLTRRQLLASLSATPLAAQTAGPQGGVLLRAMRDELERAKQLKTASRDPFYFLEYTLDDAAFYSVNAMFGALLRENSSRMRLPRVYARVGTMEFDNTNYVLSDYYFGSRYDSEQFPLDDNYAAHREAWWLATDRAFKAAQEAIGRKRAALRNVTQSEKLPDFSAAPPLQRVFPVTAKPVDTAMWKARVVAASAEMRAFPEIHDGDVEFSSTHSVSYLANWDGASVVSPEPLHSVRVRLSGQAPDGMPVRDYDMRAVLDPSRLPAEAEVRRMVQQAGQNVRALTNAPVGETYSGPVLFEGMAAAQLFGELLGTALPSTRRPVNEPNRPLPFVAGPFEGRIGSRVLPASFKVVDDPGQTEWQGRPLLGAYATDGEGALGQTLTVIDGGVLKTLLATRQPSKDAPTTNGRARMPGAFGARTAAISNLFVQTSEPVSSQDLKSQLMKMMSARSKPYVMIVRKMDFPSTASIPELRRLAQGQERPVSTPLLVYRVYPDGREELVRGLRFRGFSVRSLRDIAAASDEMTAFDFLGNGAPFSLVGAGGYVYPATVVAPSILFEDVELEAVAQDLPKPPLVPPPSLTR